VLRVDSKGVVLRRFMAALVLVSLATAASAQVRVRGYVKKDGTYVAPHVRTAPNSSRFDNYSTAPNYNPYTGKTGTVDPYALPSVPRYSVPSAPPYQPYMPRTWQMPKPKARCYGC
jgi:hypothetical protein